MRFPGHNGVAIQFQRELKSQEEMVPLGIQPAAPETPRQAVEPRENAPGKYFPGRRLKPSYSRVLKAGASGLSRL